MNFRAIFIQQQQAAGQEKKTNREANMASNSEDSSEVTLSELFKRGLDIHDWLDKSTLPTNSSEFQHQVKKGILLLEDATRLVSVLDIFSRNETVSEVQTEHLKFFRVF